MEKELFNELLESVQQVKEIMAGQKEPSRKFFIEEPNPKDIRAKLSLTQEKFEFLMNISVNLGERNTTSRRPCKGAFKCSK